MGVLRHQPLRREALEIIDLSDSEDSIIELSSSNGSDGENSPLSTDSIESDFPEDEILVAKQSTVSLHGGALPPDSVIKRIRDGDLKKLRVDQCRVYLRSHKLRVAGAKGVLVDRIRQHLDLKEGGSKNYDSSTFTINCTGDVCTGDVVKFRQKVYKKYDVAARGAAPVGYRTVAGRVIKESYGEKKQQHTFTVEVLWSVGCQPLRPMRQLLVKGRNLYKKQTLRQQWADEGVRRDTLNEKHERGAAARRVRAVKQGKIRAGPGVQQPVPSGIQKQLANPYTNTFTPQNSTQYEIELGFGSSAALQHFAALTTTSPGKSGVGVSATVEGVSVHSSCRSAVGVLPAKKLSHSHSSSGESAFSLPVPRENISARRSGESAAKENISVHRSDGSGVSLEPAKDNLYKAYQHKSSHRSEILETPTSPLTYRPRQSVSLQPWNVVGQNNWPASNRDIYAPNTVRSLRSQRKPFKPVSPWQNSNLSINSQRDGYRHGHIRKILKQCPAHGCQNQGSYLCSSRMCSHCCKRIRGKCANPKHKPNSLQGPKRV